MKKIAAYFAVLMMTLTVLAVYSQPAWGQSESGGSTNRRPSTNMSAQPRGTNTGSTSTNARTASDVSTAQPESRGGGTNTRPSGGSTNERAAGSSTNTRPSSASTNTRPSSGSTNMRPSGSSTNMKPSGGSPSSTNTQKAPATTSSTTATTSKTAQEETFLYAVSMPAMMSYGYDGDPGYDATEFYPIGFSEDGLFAYALYDDYIEGVGDCTRLHVIIQDLVTDDIEYEYTYMEEFTALPFETVWEMTYEEFDNQFATYQIKNDDLKMETFPIVHETDTLTYEFALEFDEMNMIDSFKLKIDSVKNGTKTIHRQRKTEAVNVEIAGYIDSPYEDRVAVIMIKTFKGEDGPPLPVTVFPVGCHLEKGF